MQSSPSDPGLVASLGWIDLTALAIVLVFAVLGLFRGFGWQLGRLLTLVLAFVSAMVWGDTVGARIDPWFAEGLNPRVPLFIAYVGVFLASLIVLSLLFALMERLRREAPPPSVPSRIGGGVVGLGTGGVIVVGLLATVLMFFGPHTDVAAAAHGSRSLAVSQYAVHAMGELMPPAVREVFAAEPQGRSEVGGR